MWLGIGNMLIWIFSDHPIPQPGQPGPKSVEIPYENPWFLQGGDTVGSWEIPGTFLATPSASLRHSIFNDMLLRRKKNKKQAPFETLKIRSGQLK